MTAGRPIPFVDLRPGPDHAVVAEAVARVVARGWFVLGPELEAFEHEFAEACGAAHAVGTGNGTDALALILRALDIGAGDEVIVPAMTAAFTGLAVSSVGATPAIVDVEDDCLTLDPAACAAAVTSRTKAVIAVHLYGQAALGAALEAVASRHNLALVEDCCQAHLATEGGRPVGTRGVAGAFSFYPTKNLGALGDAGAVVTNDARLADRVRRLRNGGQAARYAHVEAGINSRLDELQAAVLRARLPRLAEVTTERRRLADRYRRGLAPHVRAIRERDSGHVYHLFPVRVAGREHVAAGLADRHVETLVHYPTSLSALPAFRRFGPRACPVSDVAATELLSLPLRPGLDVDDVDRIAALVNGLTERTAS